MHLVIIKRFHFWHNFCKCISCQTEEVVPILLLLLVFTSMSRMQETDVILSLQTLNI